MILDVLDNEGKVIGKHKTQGEAIPLVVFKGKRTLIHDEGALREPEPGESIVLRYPLLAKS